MDDSSSNDSIDDNHNKINIENKNQGKTESSNEANNSASSSNSTSSISSNTSHSIDNFAFQSVNSHNSDDSSNNETTFQITLTKYPFQIKSIINLDTEIKPIVSTSNNTTSNTNSIKSQNTTAFSSSSSIATSDENTNNGLVKKKRPLTPKAESLISNSENISNDHIDDHISKENESKRAKSEFDHYDDDDTVSTTMNDRKTDSECNIAKRMELINQVNKEVEQEMACENSNNNNNVKKDDNSNSNTNKTESKLVDYDEDDDSNKTDNEKKSNEDDKIKISSNNLNKNNNTNNDEKKTNIDFLNLIDEDYWNRILKSNEVKLNTLKFNDLLKREFGLMKPNVFQNKAVNSVDYVRRMKLAKTLDFHDGCVNALNFNRIGTMLVSGSDDYQVCVYDWSNKGDILNFDSGHKSNVFQVCLFTNEVSLYTLSTCIYLSFFLKCKFIPFTGDTQIATSARDGQVRLALISTSGSHLGSKRLAKHADSCHKVVFFFNLKFL